MQSPFQVSESLARLRESVTEARQRAAERERRDEDAALLSAPIVADADTPSGRRRARQLDTLRQAHVELAQKVRQLEERASGESLDLLQHLSGLEGRVQAASGRSQAGLAQQAQAQRALENMQSLHAAISVVSTLQSTAYGQRGSLLSTNNLLLAGNQLLWTYIDPIARQLGLPIGPSPSALAYLAPLLSLVTARVTVGNRQHVRFVSGITVFGPGELKRSEDLRGRIAGGLWSEFQQRTNVPATAQPIGPVRDVVVGAEVQRGTLLLGLAPRGAVALAAVRIEGLRVAWIVDTGEDVG